VHAREIGAVPERILAWGQVQGSSAQERHGGCWVFIGPSTQALSSSQHYPKIVRLGTIIEHAASGQIEIVLLCTVVQRGNNICPLLLADDLDVHMSPHIAIRENRIVDLIDDRVGLATTDTCRWFALDEGNCLTFSHGKLLWVSRNLSLIGKLNSHIGTPELF